MPSLKGRTRNGREFIAVFVERPWLKEAKSPPHRGTFWKVERRVAS